MKIAKTMIVTILAGFTAVTGFANELKVSELSKGAKLTTVKEGVMRSAPYKLAKFPDFMKELPCVIIPRGKGNVPGAAFSFTIDQPATIYLLVHVRGKFAPEGWEKTEYKAVWLVNNSPYKDEIFKKDFPAGKVEIPEHAGKAGTVFGVGNMAVIQVK
jgi:hypothetical protein